MSDTDLAALRAEVDALNGELLRLLNRRLVLVDAIRDVKARTGRPLFDPQREAAELDQLLLGNEGPLPADAVQHLFREIFRLSLSHMQEERNRTLHVHRKGPDDDRIVEAAGHRLGAGPQLIAGPCSVETEEQVLAVAKHLKSLGVGFLRGGAWKPRTSPYSFQGLRKEGLRILRSVADEVGMAVVTEILDPRDFDVVHEQADVLQVGTRNMYNYELLRLLGQGTKPVMLKRGFMATLEEFLLAAEYVAMEGNQQIILCERGIRTHERWTRNTLDLSAVPLLKGETPFPVVVDVAHGTGRKDLMIPMAKAALAAGADAVMLEVHPNPPLALSDNAQQLDLGEATAFHRAVFG